MKDGEKNGAWKRGRPEGADSGSRGAHRIVMGVCRGQGKIGQRTQSDEGHSGRTLLAGCRGGERKGESRRTTGKGHIVADGRSMGNETKTGERGGGLLLK